MNNQDAPRPIRYTNTHLESEGDYYLAEEADRYIAWLWHRLNPFLAAAERPPKCYSTIPVREAVSAQEETRDEPDRRGILSCPFCGGRPSLDRTLMCNDYRMCCPSCDFAIVRPEFSTLVIIWNTRSRSSPDFGLI